MTATMTTATPRIRTARIPFRLARRTRGTTVTPDPYLTAENEVYLEAAYIPSGTSDLWRGSRRAR